MPRSLASSPGTEAIGAGKPARRFLAASPVSVIRVDPHHHRRIGAPGMCRPTRTSTAPSRDDAQRSEPRERAGRRGPASERVRVWGRSPQIKNEPRRFSGPRKPAVDGQCRCDACTGSAESAVTHRHNVAQRLSRNSSQIPCVCSGGSRIVPLVPATGFSPEACSASRTAERRLTTTDAPTTGRPERRWRDPGSSRIRSATRRALYLAGTMPWDLMTSIAAGLLRTFRSSFAASIDLDSALMPAVNVM